MEFPRMVYRDGGTCQRPGGTYTWHQVADQSEFDALIADGWVSSIVEIEEGEDEAPTDAPKRRGRKPKA
jgi:hypothetical protein